MNFFGEIYFLTINSSNEFDSAITIRNCESDCNPVLHTTEDIFVVFGEVNFGMRKSPLHLVLILFDLVRNFNHQSGTRLPNGLLSLFTTVFLQYLLQDSLFELAGGAGLHLEADFPSDHPFFIFGRVVGLCALAPNDTDLVLILVIDVIGDVGLGLLGQVPHRVVVVGVVVRNCLLHDDP